MRNCLACEARIKEWNGDDPNCAFPNGGTFDKRNWNCATLGELRELLYDRQDLWAFSRRSNDLSTLYVDLYDLGIPTEDGEDHLHSGDAHVFWMSWYKGRGSVDAAFLISDDGSRYPTESDLVAIIAKLKEDR